MVKKNSPVLCHVLVPGAGAADFGGRGLCAVAARWQDGPLQVAGRRHRDAWVPLENSLIGDIDPDASELAPRANHFRSIAGALLCVQSLLQRGFI